MIFLFLYYDHAATTALLNDKFEANSEKCKHSKLQKIKLFVYHCKSHLIVQPKSTFLTDALVHEIRNKLVFEYMKNIFTCSFLFSVRV